MLFQKFNATKHNIQIVYIVVVVVRLPLATLWHRGKKPSVVLVGGEIDAKW